MRARARSVLREPLLHFLGIGAALFGLFALVGDDPRGTPRLVVTQGTVEHLAATFARTWQRPPTPAELGGLVDDWIREEILTREAEAMGLDRGDIVVRRRLRQKMELLAASFAESAEPDEAALEAWLRRHPERYRLEPRLTLEQVFVSRERHGDGAETRAARLLARLREGAASERLGDPLPLPRSLEAARLSEVERLYGDAFATAVDGLPRRRWLGPVASAYGLHLVRVEERVDGRFPALAEVEDAVRRDWLADRVAAAKQAFYEALRERYEIVVEAPPAVAAAIETAARDTP
jgi:hypothetical protein